MDFHGINTVGKIWLERLNSQPIFTSAWIGRIIYALDTQTLSIGTSAGWIDIVSATQGGINNPSIPVGEIILFESDTAVFGYSLKTGIDDQLVYISSGGAGGAKPGSTWTQPDHNHSAGTHTHPAGTLTGGSHTHTGQTDFESSIGVNRATGGNSSHTHQFTTDPESVSISGNTGQSSGTVDNNATANSWRPKGRNFTRQERL